VGKCSEELLHCSFDPETTTDDDNGIITIGMLQLSFGVLPVSVTKMCAIEAVVPVIYPWYPRLLLHFDSTRCSCVCVFVIFVSRATKVLN
jgi:hypothetical protein